MARTALTPLTATDSNIKANGYLIAIRATPASHGAIFDYVPGKPTRARGKNRNGQHRGHVCSRTSSGGTKKKGN